MAETQKKISVRLDPPFMGATDLGVTLVTTEQHGEIRFSAVGVAWGPKDDPRFAPWVQVAGVEGWEPPITGKKGE